MAPAADQDDHNAKALEKTKRLKTMFDMDAPKWDQELEKDDKKTTWQDDEKTPTQRPTRSEYPVNIDWSKQEELTRSAQSCADMAHEAWTQRESHVGTVHILGETTAGAAESLYDDAITAVSKPPKPIVAEAVASDSLAIEIRNDLLYEIREEMQGHSVVTAVQPYSPDPAEPPFWT
jgi:hypothetical protein